MARQVLPIVGAVIGAYFGNPQLGYAIGSIIGNAVDPLEVQGPQIGDVAAQTSAEGVFQPIFFGTCVAYGNIIDQGPNIIREQEDQAKGGGPVTVSERLYKSFAIRIGCGWNGPIAAVTRIWEDGKLVYDTRPDSEIPDETFQFAQGIRIYLGTDDQLPDPELEAIHGVGNAPAYAGRAYIVFIKKDITDRKSISEYRFEVATLAEIVPPPTAIALVSFGSSQGFKPSPDGIDWSSPTFASPLPSNLRGIYGTPDCIFGWSSSEVFWTEDTGKTWNGPINLPGGNTGVNAHYADDSTGFPLGLYLISSSYGLYYSQSQDGPWLFDPIDGHDQSSAHDITTFDGRIYATAGIYRVLYINVGGEWISSSSHNIPNALIASGNGQIRVAGRENATTTPKIKIYNIGDDLFVDMPLPAMTGATSITNIEYCEGISAWIAGTDSGHLLYESGEGWQLSSDSLNNYVDSIISGPDFVVVSSPDSGPIDGQIAYSYDGDNFVIANSDAGNVQSLAIQNKRPDVTSGMPIQLDDAVSAIHSFVGQDNSKFDVSDLEEIELDGLVLAGGYSAAESIATIGQTFLFDSPQVDGKIRHVLRGKDVVASFGINDLVDIPDESMREQAIEFPKKLLMEFQNPYVDYAPAVAPSTRESSDIRVVGVANVQTPVTMDADKAYKLASILHKISWEEAKGDVVFSAPDNYSYLTSGDCVGLTLRGITRRLRITKLEYYDGQIKLTCRNDRQSAYTSNVTGINPPVPTPPPPSVVTPSTLEILDIPALVDVEDVNTPLIHIASGPTSEVWPGSVVQRSTDGGQSYFNEAAFTRHTVMGFLQNDMTAADPSFTDTTNVVNVVLDVESDQIDSIELSEFLSEGGAFAVESGGDEWEIMQYMDSDNPSDGNFILSTLHRGQLNSGAPAHTAGQRVVMLPRVQVAPASSSLIGVDLYHRAITNGLTSEGATVENQVFVGRSQIEFPCAELILTLESDSLTAIAVPRHRFGTDINPVRSANWQGYRFTMTDGVNSESIDSISDGVNISVSGWSTPITVTVSQVNRITGPGPTISEVIE